MRSVPFVLRKGGSVFDTDSAAWLADVAQLAYAAPSDAIGAFKVAGARKIVPFDCKGTQAVMAEFQDFGVLAFRGTERDHRDILTDLKIRQRQLKDWGGKVHRGFYEALSRVLPQIAREWPQDDKPVFITGHSLGGALAVLCARAMCWASFTRGEYRIRAKRHHR